MESPELKMAERVRIELVMHGYTYELELAPADKADLGIDAGELKAALSLGYDTDTDIDPSGMWVETRALETATLKLLAHGRLVKAERRTP